jgi:hypothetical protein
MKRTHHPTFTPDLAPSDFCLFGKVKTALMDTEFRAKCDLFDAGMGVLNAIPHGNLEAVVDEYLMRSDIRIQKEETAWRMRNSNKRIFITNCFDPFEV